MSLLSTRATPRAGRDLGYVIVQTAQIASTALTIPVLSRLLSVDQFGRLAAILVLGQLLGAVMGLGMVGIVQRTYFSHGPARARELVGVSAGLIAGCAALFVASGPLWAGLMGFGGYGGLIPLAVAWSGLVAATQILAYGLRAADDFAGFAATLLFQFLGFFGAGFVAAVMHASAFSVVMAYASVQLGAFAIGWARFRPLPLRRAHWRLHANLVWLGLGLVPQAVAFFVINAIDRLMIQAYLGPVAVARYQIAYNLGAVTLVVSNYFHQTWESGTFAIEDPHERLARNARARDALVTVLGCGCAAAGCLAPIGLQLWAPPSFSVDRLGVLLVTIAASAIPLTLGLAQFRILIALRRTRYTMAASVAGATVVAAANVVLIPALGLEGAALGLLVANSTFWLYVQFLVPRPHVPGPAMATWVTVAAGVGVGLGGAALPASVAWLTARVVMAAACVAYATTFLSRLALEPSSPAVEPSGPAVEPSGPAVEPSGPAVEPSGPAVEPGSPAVEPSGLILDPS